MRNEYDHGFYRQQIGICQERLDKLREQGTGALSNYDINIAHSGDADAALRTAIDLNQNHIAYFSSGLESLGPEVQQPTLFESPTIGAFTHPIFEAPSALTRDEHLEDAYDLSQGKGFDFEDGRWDNDPSPYDGTYSEE